MNKFFKILILTLITIYSTSLYAISAAVAVAGSIAMGAAGNTVMNAGMAAMLAIPCSGPPPKPPDVLSCVMAAQSVSQVFVGSGTKNQAKQGVQALTGNADWDTTDLGNGYTGSQYDADFVKAESQAGRVAKDLNKFAPNIDLKNGTIKTPKGVKSLSGLTSGKAMLDAGLISADQVAQADQLIAQRNSKLQQISMNSSTGGGGGRAAASAKFEYTSPDYSGLFGQGEKEKPNAPKTGGLVTVVDGQPYGASINNLFDMLHTRYRAKAEQKDYFLGE